MMYYKHMASPVGRLTLVAREQGLAAILWEHERPKRVPLDVLESDGQHRLLLDVERQLTDYFDGKRQRFNLPLAPVGTVFQQQVWEALRSIPFGETRSYAQIACQIGNVRAVRAVGAANGRNPISIIVPCHRVIGSNGTLTGFAGGLSAKAYLLDLESQHNAHPDEHTG